MNDNWLFTLYKNCKFNIDNYIKCLFINNNNKEKCEKILIIKQ